MSNFNYNIIKVEIETIINQNKDFDDLFFEYLDEYSISHKITEEIGEFGYPVIEYTGGPVSLSNMLKEKFGMDKEDINKKFPQIENELS